MVTKSTIFGFVLIGCIVSGCHHDDGNPSVNWGITSSGADKSTAASGSIDHQNDGAKVTYISASSYVLDLKNKNLFQVTFIFTTADSLRLIVAKNTNDYNYHYPAAATENQLRYAIFNRDTLTMTESALAIQPQATSNTFSTVTNVHTSDHGDFNGTINAVILIER